MVLLLAFLLPTVNAGVIVKGRVTDTEGNPLAGIIIRLYQDTKVKGFANSKRDGSFAVKADTITLPALLTFASKSFGHKEITVESLTDSIYAVLTPEHYQIKEVVVKALRVRVKGDTITYDVAAHTGKGDRSIEDVIKKLPGIEVSETGVISYDGEPINNFYIEGLNLMGGNYAVASQNIKPQDVAAVSVYERHQPKKALKNVVESKSAALNLKLKKGSMLKPVGYVSATGGYGDETLWGANLYTMFISPKNQTIVSAKGNNWGNDYVADKKSGDNAFTSFPVKPFGAPSIKGSRYILNKSAYATTNTLFKLREELTLTLNASYGQDDDGYDSYSSTEYLATDMANPIYSESVDNGIKKHSVNAGVKIEKNSNGLYLMDHFTFKGRFDNNDYDIINTSGINQRMKGDNYAFNNNLSVIANRNRKVYKLDSRTSFSNTPMNHISAYDAATGGMTLRQDVTGRSFHNMETTGFSWETSRRSQVGTDATFNIDYDSFLSNAVNGRESAGRNDISGHNLSLGLAPYYKYVIRGKIVLQATLPLEWRNIRYTDIVSEKSHRFNKFYLNLDLDLFYKFLRNNEITFNAGWRHDTGDIRNFIENPIYTTFRNRTTLGTGSLIESLNKSATLRYSYKDQMRGFIMRGSVSYSYKTVNSTSVYDVSQDGTSSSSVNLDSHSDMTNFMATAIKHVYSWHSRLSLNVTGMSIGRESMRSGNVIKTRNDIYTTSLSAESDLLNDMLTLTGNFSYSYTRNSFHGFMPDNNLSEIMVNGKVSVFPVKGLEIYGNLSFNRSQLAEDNYKSNLFVDAGIKYKLRKFDFTLSGRNLTNLRNYGYTLYNTLDITTYSYSLRPIECVATVRFNF